LIVATEVATKIEEQYGDNRMTTMETKNEGKHVSIMITAFYDKHQDTIRKSVKDGRDGVGRVITTPSFPLKREDR